MKRLMMLILFLGAIASANLAILQDAVIVAATDLTNTNKSDYAVYVDLADSVAVSKVIAGEGSNLCENKAFAAHAGSFTCKRKISYHLSTLEDADIIITDTGITHDGKVLVACTKNFETCDITAKPFKVNTENLLKKGFMPDPSLK